MIKSHHARKVLTGFAALVAAASIHAGANAIRHEEVIVKAPFDMPAINIPLFPQRDFVITDFGAKPGGETKNTEAIRKAIAACHESGGGRLVDELERIVRGIEREMGY